MIYTFHVSRLSQEVSERENGGVNLDRVDIINDDAVEHNSYHDSVPLLTKGVYCKFPKPCSFISYIAKHSLPYFIMA